MLNFMTMPPTNDRAAHMIKRRLEEAFETIEGVAYYKHSMARTKTNVFPDFTVFTKVNQPLVIKIIPYQLQEIDFIDDDMWIVNKNPIESPFTEIEDLRINIENQFRNERNLRNLLMPQAILALPFIIQKDFEDRFGRSLHQDDIHIVWSASNSHIFHYPLNHALTDEEWTLTRAVIQGVTLYKPSKVISSNITSLAAAIRELDKEIAALDDEQEAATIKIAPGPQRIRGLAGTGKTVLLAIKAANIHILNPEKKILFTFNTRSLYNQARNLISSIYRARMGTDPNWDFLHIRHAWGGKTTGPGVYSEICARQGRSPLSYNVVRSLREPLQRCCQHALERPVHSEYDFVLVDEAQDFPKEFFRILYRLATSEHRIYWAYDELQSLSSSWEIPNPRELFGTDKEGKPLVSLEGSYPDGTEKDIELPKSYRCPLPILMLAHGIGLGIKSPQGCVQMLENKGDWEAIGYELESGKLQQGEDIVIFRPASNSPNRIYDIYNKQQLITTQNFQTREAELAWIADSIYQDIHEEKVAPQKIVVISLNDRPASQFEYLKKLLTSYGIASVTPGLFNDPSDAFAEVGKVTLATVRKAKGNETHIVYIINFDALYDYVKGIGNRNKAFASITRSKAWVRITGIGRKMEMAQREVDAILSDIPRFKLKFPDMKEVRRLGAESSKRRKVVDKMNRYTNTLLDIDQEALAAMDIEKLKRLQERLNEVIEENS